MPYQAGPARIIQIVEAGRRERAPLAFGVTQNVVVGLVLEHVRGEVASVLGWTSPDQVGLQQKLFELGMDSLTSVELRHRLEKSLGCSLPLTVAFDYPNAEALAAYMLQQLRLQAEEPSEDEQPADEPDEEAERLAEMSEEEVESLLAEKFKDLL